VSIDGPPEVHDANRRYPGTKGGGTYADIVAGLDRLRERMPRPPAARVTLTPDQWGRVPEVFDHLHGLGFLEVGIAPASPINAGLLPTPEQDETLFTGFAELARRFASEAAEGRVLPFSNLLDVLGRLHVGQVKSAPCGAGLGYLALDTEGRFFLCHRLAGVERFRVGDLDRGIDHAKIAAGGAAAGCVQRVLGAQPLRGRLPPREPRARKRSRAGPRRVLRFHPAMAGARHPRLRRPLPRSRQPRARLPRPTRRRLTRLQRSRR
jgi:hypothetical protein